MVSKGTFTQAQKMVVAAAALVSFTLGANAQADSKRYLVRFKSPETYVAVSQKAKMDVAHGQSSNFGFMGSKAVIAQTFDNVQALVIEAQDEASVASLQNHPAVESVEAEMFHPLPPPVSTFGVEYYKKKNPPVVDPTPAPGSVAVKIDMPWGIKAVKAPEAWKTTKGSGATVLILDTGIDKDHPAIKGRLIAAKNFFSAGFPTPAVANAKKKAAPPYDYFDEVGHGTHVAGTIAADGLNNGLVGVAPEAKIMAGRVCGEEGCSSIAIVAGVEWGIKEKVSVMSLSLGGPMASATEVKAFQAAERAGIVVVAASGNDGKQSVSYPAALPNVFAVGAVDVNLAKAKFSNWGPELAIVAPGVAVLSSVPLGSGREAKTLVDTTGKGLSEIESAGFQGSPLMKAPVSGELEFCGLGQATDFKSCNVKGKVALIARGQIKFSDKVTNAINAGAIGALVYNNEAGVVHGSLTEDGSEVAIPVVGIEQKAGEDMRDLIKKGQKVTASVVLQATDYSSYDGTSMATPHVSGVVALMLAANNKLTPSQVRDIITTTATALSGYKTNEVGKGLINAEAAVAKAKALSGTHSVEPVMAAVGL